MRAASVSLALHPRLQAQFLARVGRKKILQYRELRTEMKVEPQAPLGAAVGVAGTSIRWVLTLVFPS